MSEGRIHQLGAVGFRVMGHGKVHVEKSDLHRFGLVARISEVNVVHAPALDELEESARCIHG